MSEARKPFWVKCTADGHVWAAAYSLMDAETFGATIQAARCPWCGARKGIVVAKQNDGQLNEPLAPHQQEQA
jgi:hypothetical protein